MPLPMFVLLPPREGDRVTAERRRGGHRRVKSESVRSDSAACAERRESVAAAVRDRSVSAAPPRTRCARGACLLQRHVIKIAHPYACCPSATY